MHTDSVPLLATAAGINRYTLEATIPETVVNENTEMYIVATRRMHILFKIFG